MLTFSMNEKETKLLAKIKKLQNENKLLSNQLEKISQQQPQEQSPPNKFDLKNYLHAALSKQRIFLYKIIDTVPNLIYVKTYDGKYILANKATAEFYGTNVKDIIGKTDSNFIHDKKILQKIKDDDQDVIKNHVTKDMPCEKRYDCNNKEIYFKTKKVLLNIESEKQDSVLGISTDITEMKNNEVGLNYLNESLTKIYNSVHDAIALFDPCGRIIDVNERMLNMFDILYNEALQFKIYPDYIADESEFIKFSNIIPLIMKGKDQQIELKVIQPKSKKTLYINLAMTKVNLGTGDTILATISDVTELKKDREIIDMLSLAIKQSPTSIVITDDQGIIEYINPKFIERSGYTKEDIIGKHAKSLKSSVHDNDFYKEIGEAVSSGKDWHGEICNKNKNGTLYWESVSVSPILNETGEHTNYVAVSEDISERKKQAEKIEFLALHDVLTGLPNRNLFINRLEVSVERAKRNNHMIALMFIDLDGFKAVNDTYGHKTGDNVLIETSKRIVKCHRKIDTTARIGGDEFVTILEDIKDKKSIEVIAKRIISALNKKFISDGSECYIGCSIGISMCPNDTEDIDILIKKADIAMYNVKNTVKNNYCFYENMITTTHSSLS